MLTASLLPTQEVKKEIEFLCSIINCFDIKDIDKKTFSEEILQYWMLSVKDPKWSNDIYEIELEVQQ